MGYLDAIYTRQSVDRIDSISVESQTEFCKKEVSDGQYRIYTDKGYSGKNTDRPAFQKMMQDIESGEIRRVIVYRLDRISRSVLDFANVIGVCNNKYSAGGCDFHSLDADVVDVFVLEIVGKSRPFWDGFSCCFPYLSKAGLKA